MKEKHHRLIVAIFIFMSVGMGLQAQAKYTSDWESIDSRPVPQWFTDAKFGIFIHWGVYSVPAWCPGGYSEWYWHRLVSGKEKALVDFHQKNYGRNFLYQDFASQFKCELFQPDDWAELFREAGAKYVVLTSKHHDGFTLWPSAQSWNWNSVDVGPHRDLAGDLTTSVKNAGLHMGFYYSLYEWYNPLYNSNLDRYVDEHMIPQLKDLVNSYHPDIVWTDGEWSHPSDKFKSTDFLAWLYNESPVKESVVVNDRWGKETRSVHGGIYTTEYGHVNGAALDEKNRHPWEECRGIGHSFGFNRNEKLDDYSTSDSLVHLLIEKVSMGGNLLLNIGPTADGRIPVIMQERLADMGKWLKINGEAIYETSMWSVASSQPEISVYFTTKGKDLYIICTRYPEKEFTIENLLGKPLSVSLLGSKSIVKHSYGNKKLTIVPPVLTPGNIPCDYAWVFKVSGCLMN